MRETLVRWLAGRTVEQLAALVDVRPFVSEFGRPPGSLEQLADRLLQPYSVEDSLERVDQRELQVLSAAVTLAARNRTPQAPGGGSSLRSGRPDPSGRSSRGDARVRECEVVVQFAPENAERVREVVVRMREKLLFFPGEPGELVLHHALMTVMDASAYRPRPVGPALTEAFNKPEVRRIARGLGLPDDGSREEVQGRVVAWLSEPVLVRALLAEAPPQAAGLLEQMVAQVTPVRTGRFSGYSGYGKYRFAASGSGDAGVDWLSERGFLVPLDEELVEVPLEVVQAVRGPLWPAFTAHAPVPTTVEVRPVRVRHEAQAALSAAVAKTESLGRALDVRPASVRKAGGLAVRETRRLAGAMGVPEEEARLWIDLATMAGLLGVRQTRPARRGARGARQAGESALLPTERFDAWLGLSPARRLEPLLRAWAGYEDVITWWPDPRVQPVALALPQDRMAVELRRAVLRVLAALPDDRACDLGHPRVLEELADAAAFHRPLALFTDPVARLTATLREASLLGAVAHGALTPVGQALWSLLEHPPRQPEDPVQPGRTESVVLAEQVDRTPGEAGRTESMALAEQVDRTSGRAGQGESRVPAGRADRGLAGRDGLEGDGVLGALEEALPAPVGKAVFQADLTVVVAGIPEAGLAGLLGSVAERESQGQAVVWRISQGSVRRALDAGASAGELLDRLAGVAVAGLPQPLTYLITDTARRHGGVRVVRSGCCLRAQDETLLRELTAHTALRKLGLRLIASTVLISSRPVGETLETLREAGYAPVLEDETGDTVIERRQSERAPSGTFARRPRLDGMAVAAALLKP